MTPWQFSRSTEKSESQDSGHDSGHDDTKNERDKYRLRLTDQKQKRVWRVQGKGVINQVFSNHNSALSSININAPRCSWCINVDG